MIYIVFFNNRFFMYNINLIFKILCIGVSKLDGFVLILFLIFFYNRMGVKLN